MLAKAANIPLFLLTWSVSQTERRAASVFCMLNREKYDKERQASSPERTRVLLTYISGFQPRLVPFFPLTQTFACILYL